MAEDYILFPKNIFADLTQTGMTAENIQLLSALMLCANKDGYTDITEAKLAEYLGIRRETISRRITALSKRQYEGDSVISVTKHRPTLIKISEKLGVSYFNDSPVYDDRKYEEDRGGSYRSIVGYNPWKKAVKERDKCCLKCGSVENLVAHHIENYLDNIEMRTDIDNGSTLCNDCHIEFHKRFGYRGTNGKHLAEYLRKE